MTEKKTARRVAAGVGAFALAAAGMVGASSAAYAEVGPDQPNAPTSGTLTINKYGGLPVDQGGDLSDPLTGVEFTVQEVGTTAGGSCEAIDLTAAADWDGLEDLFAASPAEVADPFCLTGQEWVQSTVDGSTTFDLGVGVYFVQETDHGDNPIVSSVPDFFVSIPTSTGAGADGWEYNVIADPKNQLMDEPSKTIEEDPSGLVVGSNVTWTIDVPIPTLAEGETFDSASVHDVLDSRLSYVSSELSIGGTDLVEGTHYQLDADGVSWVFTNEGLAVLDANMGESIQVSLVTRVDSVGDGAIANAGGEDGNYWSEFNGTTRPGDTTPYTYWGQLSILKTDDSTPVQNLEGAEFQVFDTQADGSCLADAPADGAIATGTSDGNGVVQWENVTPANVLGLWVAHSEDGPLPNPSKDYCVYETVIPAGHSAIPVENPVTITPGENNINDLTVVNPKKDGPDLPLTGAQGTLLLTVSGLLLVAIGASAVIASRRKRNHVG